MTKDQFAKTLDMTLLKPEADRDAIVRLCESAAALKPASVCIYPIWIRAAARVLEGSGVPVCTVIGFPTGCSVRPVKAQEVKAAVLAGATEIDMVMNLGAAKSGDWGEVERELKDLVDTARVAGLEKGAAPIVTKVIIECCFLTDEEKARAAGIVRDVAADFVKTSTGFGSGGATVEDVQLLRQTVGPDMGVKAAGGIRTIEQAMAMLSAGATRLGTSNAEGMLQAFQG
ncbi:MAG TPA: deoxyribose-phosphate aldolase [Armatimonadota bacterium]|jgi:deoxyribose-phosphate aldolase